MRISRSPLPERSESQPLNSYKTHDFLAVCSTTGEGGGFWPKNKGNKYEEYKLL